MLAMQNNINTPNQLDEVIFNDLQKKMGIEKITYPEAMALANQYQAQFWPFWLHRADIADTVFLALLSQYTGLDVASIDSLSEVHNLIQTDIGQPFFQHQAIALSITSDAITVLVATPQAIEWLQQWQLHHRHSLTIQLCSLENFLKYNTKLSLDASFHKYRIQQQTQDTALSDLANHLMHYALAHGASDIHGEPRWNGFVIRMRIHGILEITNSLTLSLSKQLTNRFKILSQCDVANTRLPQDGHISIDHYPTGKQDARIHFCKTLHGEKWVIRLLPNNRSLVIDELGFSPQDLSNMKKSMSQPQGLILVTGPTGSGKTTTLYALLQTLNHHAMNITTIEDPVEKELDHINQIQTNHAIGFDFSTGLKSLLRQDPDVIMIGEIRDTETASIALKAAQTGHLVLATLHSNSTTHTISRLLAMGFHPELLSQTIITIVAQRLARKICVKCRRGIKNCAHCHDGYSSRIPIYECMMIDKAIRAIIEKLPFEADLLEMEACRLGMKTLKQSAQDLVNEGITDSKEIHRVIVH
jgi:type II secretory ATPase GspE/PulE/Tfp pilus assembly ATPase PilB-like protein